MFGSTMMLTIGQALDRSQNEGTPVRLNIAGTQITGKVVNSDGQAAMIAEDNGDICVVRTDAITFVRLPAQDRSTHVPSQATDSPVQAPA